MTAAARNEREELEQIVRAAMRLPGCALCRYLVDQEPRCRETDLPHAGLWCGRHLRQLATMRPTPAVAAALTRAVDAALRELTSDGDLGAGCAVCEHLAAVEEDAVAAFVRIAAGPDGLHRVESSDGLCLAHVTRVAETDPVIGTHVIADAESRLRALRDDLAIAGSGSSGAGDVPARVVVAPARSVRLLAAAFDVSSASVRPGGRSLDGLAGVACATHPRTAADT